MKKAKKILLGILAAVLAIAICAVAVIGVMWRNEIASYLSISQLTERNDDNQEGSVWYMEAHGDYYFPEFLAQGGAKSDKELIAYMTSHLTRGLINATISESDIGCSSFTAALANGERVMGRNYDMSKTNVLIVRTEASGDRHATISSADLSFLGLSTDRDPATLMDKLTMTLATYVPLDGINDAGVSMSIHMSYQGLETDNSGKTHTVATNVDTDKPDITSTTMIRMVLDYADSVESAVNLIQQYDLHDSANTSFHYIIADATGRSAILEWVSGDNTSDNDAGSRELVVTYMDADDSIGTA